MTNQQNNGKSCEFQFHGKCAKQTMAYSKVLEQIILKFQSSFNSTNVIVTILHNIAKKIPADPNRTRIYIAYTVTNKEIDTVKFEQETAYFKHKSDLDKKNKNKL